MRTNLYVSMSGQIALQKRLDTVAANIANMNTAGYRAQGVAFSSVLSTTGERPASFVTTGTDYIARGQGGTTKTDNPLDVAIQGDAWFAVQTPQGTAYTRDGRMQMTANGELQSLNGYPMLDAGGGKMLLEADGGPPTIAADGMMSQNGRQVGAIGLFSIPDDAVLTRHDNSAVMPDKAATPVLDFSRNSMVQGFSEGSNVNPILEMTKLIEIQRAFDGLSGAAQSSESSLQDAIKTLGSNS
jgi:flagellar basal-body rod protein FlgF